MTSQVSDLTEVSWKTRNNVSGSRDSQECWESCVHNAVWNKALSRVSVASRRRGGEKTFSWVLFGFFFSTSHVAWARSGVLFAEGEIIAAVLRAFTERLHRRGRILHFEVAQASLFIAVSPSHSHIGHPNFRVRVGKFFLLRPRNFYCKFSPL